jgi:hypothetical protein
LNPVTHGEAAADIAKMFEQNLHQKSVSAKNNFCKLPQPPDFCCMYVYLKNSVFDNLRQK